MEHTKIIATFNSVFAKAPIGIAISISDTSTASDNNRFLIMNPKFQQIIGRTQAELNELGWTKITHPADVDQDLENFAKLKAGEISDYAMNKRFIKPDGTIAWVHMIVARLFLSDTDHQNHICLVQDITKHKEIEADFEESERSKSVLLSNLPGMAYRSKYDREWTMQYVSAGCMDLTGYKQESFINNQDLSFNDIIAPTYREMIWEEWHTRLATRTPFHSEYQIITKSGEQKWVMEMGQGIYNKQGEIEALEGIILDISDKKEIEENLIYNAQHDSWTGLYNQAYLEQVLRRDAHQQTGVSRALVGLNLSYLHSLTLVYGFSYTRQLIKQVATTLQEFCKEDCMLFLMYENQFVFYVKNYNDRGDLELFCKTVAHKLASLLVIERIDTGIGVVEINHENMLDTDQVLKSLLIASEKAVENLDDFPICFFDQDMEREIMWEENLKRELLRIATGKDEHQLFLEYQPIVDLKTNQITGFEALARLKDDRFGLVSPLEFIPLAEETKLIIPLGEKIILQAFDFLTKLKENGYDSINISINISAIQVLKLGFGTDLKKMITTTQVSPHNITLEITESVFAENHDDINRVLGELKDYGVKIAIDDFGTGYSSLARERELNANSLKIDKSFIDTGV